MVSLGYPKAERLDERELLSFKEMLMANGVQVDAVAQSLIEKRIIAEEFYGKLKEVQREYEGNKGD